MLLDSNAIAKDVILMFDEMYLQKHKEYAGGKLIGADTDKGVVCYMIIGLKENIPFVVKAIPETAVNSDWLKEILEGLLTNLHDIGFRVRHKQEL